MTSRLATLLTGRKGFTRQVCEQLKKSNICEILPPDVDVPTSDSAVADTTINPAAAASTGIGGRKPSAAANELLPRGPGPGTQVGEEKRLENDDGVLDIASIVTSGNMSEYLAQKEQEKAERLAAKQHKKGSDAQLLAASKPVRQPNHKRTRNTFMYEDFVLHDAMRKAGMSNQSMAEMQSAMDEGPNKRQKTPEPQSAVSDRPADSTFTAPSLDGAAITDSSHIGALRREIEVGPERFQAASGNSAGEPGLLDRLADAIHRSVQSCPDSAKRTELWESLIIVGNGAKLRGFKDALLDTLQRKYIISPSAATIFTSELPSSLTTPMGTGANTPQPTGHYPGSQHPLGLSGVNPLAQNPQLQHLQHLQHPLPQFAPPSSSSAALGLAPPPAHHPHHNSHAPPQTPTAIRLAKIPEYFPEWKEVGYDEAVFLGAQVAAKVLFVVDAGASKGYLSRTEYNELGPGGMGEVFL